MAIKDDKEAETSSDGGSGVEEADEAAQPKQLAVLPGEATGGAAGQLGIQRFVFAAYFAFGIGTSLVSAKLISAVWHNLQNWKPVVGEPKDEFILPMAALLGVGLAVHYFRKTEMRERVEQTATELSKVTWPGKTEVTNSTAVVIVTTLVSTVFFLLMDRLWGYITGLIYGT